MLKTDVLVPLTPFEREFYEEIVPVDHFLRRMLEIVDFDGFRPVLAQGYSSDHGRPALDPVFLLKLELLARQYNLSDREVVGEARYNIAYRLFLGLSLKSPLPHHTTLTYYRQRLGEERLQQVFDTLVGQARRLGLVKDRLRLKDATHIIANIAVPSTIRLVAETRDRVLEALRPFAAERVAAEEQRAEAIRLGSEDAKDDERLLQRVTHLRSVLAWADAVPQEACFAQGSGKQQDQLRQALTLAHKVLADREDPKAKDKVRSVHDPDARCGKHGKYYDGYLMDVAMDADSEIITAVHVLPANGDEATDTAALIRQEEQAHGNDVQAVSMDGAGYRGEVLQELTDPAGLNLEVFVPPTPWVQAAGFSTEQFTRSDDGTLTCPAGQTTKNWQHHGVGVQFSFTEEQCGSCPLRSQCLTQPNARRRTVFKNDYEAVYAAAKAKAATPAYAEVRRQHPAIERKLSEFVRRHDARHARYRGRRRVWVQQLLTGMVINLKRMVRLLFAPPEPAVGTVRAELVASG